MPEYIGSEPNWVDKIGFIGVVLALILLFVAMSQPVWRGQEMLAEYKANCDKVGGVILERHGMFGTSYECSPRYDQGIKQ